MIEQSKANPKIDLSFQKILESKSQKLSVTSIRENGDKKPEVRWSSYKGLTVDTLAHRGDEGRGYLR